MPTRKLSGRTTPAACLAAATGGLLLGAAGSASAAGFFLIEQSVSAMGTAYAGAAALANDPSTLYFNPAGMTRLEGAQGAVGVHLVKPEARFDDDGSFHLTSPLGRGLGRREGGDAGVLQGLPNLYYTHRVGPRLALGLAVNVPFGLTTDYDDGWIGRYHSDRAELLTVNINPAAAFRVTDRISVGGGVNYQYVDADLTNDVDIGGLLSPLLATRLDGSLQIKGSDWSWGWNLGTLIELSEATRVGLHYRSGVEHEALGSVELSAPVLGALGVNPLLRPGASSEVELPATASASLYHSLNEHWALLADVTWTEWSNLQELRFEFDSLLPDGVEELRWEDSFRYALGAEYRPNGRWTWRFGAAFDESPVPGPELRTPRVPDSDRVWVTAGLGYEYSSRLGFDLGYAHLFVDTPEVDRVDPLEVARLRGDYEASVDILSAQVRWRFF